MADPSPSSIAARPTGRFASSARTGISGSRRSRPAASRSALTLRARPDLRRFRVVRHRPGPLGADVSSSPLAWQTHDLEQMLLGARRLGVPMIIGSAGDTGTNSRVDLFVRIIQELARKHALAEVPPRLVSIRKSPKDAHAPTRMAAGEAIEGLDGRAALDAATLGGDGAGRRGRRRASVPRAAGAGCRRHHRRAQQRLRDLRRPGDAGGISRRARLLLRQDPGMRLVLRGALRGKGIGARRDHAWTT